MPRSSRRSNLSPNGDSNSVPDVNHFNAQSFPRQTMAVTEFWEHDPDSWFISTEAGFRAERITDPVAMYNHVVRCLDGRQIRKIRSRMPHETDPDCYSNLRTLLLDTYSVPLRDRIRELFSGGCRGQRPSEILDKLRSATNGHNSGACSEEYIKEMFFHYLPQYITSVLSAHIDDNCDQLALRADSIYDRAARSPSNGVGPSVSHSSNQDNSESQTRKMVSDMLSEFQTLRNDVNEIKVTYNSPKDASNNYANSPLPPRLNALPQHSRNGGRSKPGRYQRGYESNAYPTRPGHSNQYCYYHQRFGRNARKCQQPCGFSERRPFLG